MKFWQWRNNQFFLNTFSRWLGIHPFWVCCKKMLCHVVTAPIFWHRTLNIILCYHISYLPASVRGQLVTELTRAKMHVTPWTCSDSKKKPRHNLTSVVIAFGTTQNQNLTHSLSHMRVLADPPSSPPVHNLAALNPAHWFTICSKCLIRLAVCTLTRSGECVWLGQGRILLHSLGIIFTIVAVTSQTLCSYPHIIVTPPLPPCPEVTLVTVTIKQL